MADVCCLCCLPWRRLPTPQLHIMCLRMSEVRPLHEGKHVFAVCWRLSSSVHAWWRCMHHKTAFRNGLCLCPACVCTISCSSGCLAAAVAAAVLCAVLCCGMPVQIPGSVLWLISHSASLGTQFLLLLLLERVCACIWLVHDTLVTTGLLYPGMVTLWCQL